MSFIPLPPVPQHASRAPYVYISERNASWLPPDLSCINLQRASGASDANTFTSRRSQHASRTAHLRTSTPSRPHARSMPRHLQYINLRTSTPPHLLRQSSRSLEPNTYDSPPEISIFASAHRRVPVQTPSKYPSPSNTIRPDRNLHHVGL